MDFFSFTSRTGWSETSRAVQSIDGYGAVRPLILLVKYLLHRKFLLSLDRFFVTDIPEGKQKKKRNGD